MDFLVSFNDGVLAEVDHEGEELPERKAVVVSLVTSSDSMAYVQLQLDGVAVMLELGHVLARLEGPEGWQHLGSSSSVV